MNRVLVFSLDATALKLFTHCLNSSNGDVFTIDTKYYSAAVTIVGVSAVSALEDSLPSAEALILLPNEGNQELQVIKDIDIGDFVRLVLSNHEVSGELFASRENWCTENGFEHVLMNFKDPSQGMF